MLKTKLINQRFPSTDAIQTKQDDFNDALAAMAPAIVSNDSDDDEWD